MRRILCALTILTLLLITSPASAVIVRLTALSEILEESTFVVTATVDKLDEKRPSMVLKIDDRLAGKPTFESLPVLLTGNAGAIKRKEPAELLKRLAVKLPLILFISKNDDEYTAFAYTEGTWFTMTGVKVEGNLRWSFSNLEPYLRRTYKGTTKEMIQTAKDALAKKKAPPKPNEKEKPGLGPEVPKKQGALDQEESPRYAVVPTVLIGGPLMLLAMLFPTAFGGWRRWLVLLSTAGTNSTLFTLHWWFCDDLAGTWSGSPVTLWAVMGVFNVLGVVWAWHRHLALVQSGDAPGRPGLGEIIVLGTVSVLGVAMLVVLTWFEQKLLSAEWMPVVAYCAAIWVGALYALYARIRPSRMTPAVATEAVVLAGLTAISLVLGTTLQGRATARGLTTGEKVARISESVTVVWKFRLPSKGGILSSPIVVGDNVYIAAAHDAAFRPFGVLYCLDRGTGQEKWTFSDKKKMKPIFSTPVVADGKLFVGEGFHQDYGCKVYCLDATSGKKLWEFSAGNHTESTGCVVGSRLFIGAGDDGLYCLDVASGKQVWNFPSFHIDAPPKFANGRIFAGCGVGDTFKDTALFCLDAKEGKPVWRMNTTLPVWGKPIVSGGFVYAGTGNGRVNEAADQPAGEMLCLREENGEIVWRKKYSDGLLASPAADRRHLYFGCRDGHFYCLRRFDGSLAWKYGMGSEVVSTPALEVGSEESPADRLYALAIQGHLACMDARTGKLIWSREMADLSKSNVEAISSPALESLRDRDGAEMWRLYVGVTLVSTGRTGELYCIEDRTRPGD